MADTILQQATPIIPVIDERLACLPTAPSEHKAKIAEYNELLEVIFQREVELTSIKSSLVDMREVIAQEARILEGASVVQEAAVKSESESDIDADHVLSDSSSGQPGKPDAAVKKVAKKNKKPKGSRRSKVPNVELGDDWDYKLEGRGSARAAHESDIESDAEVLP